MYTLVIVHAVIIIQLNTNYNSAVYISNEMYYNTNNYQVTIYEK